MQNSLLIFDFDGVLLNSVDEVAVTAYNTVTDKLLTTREELPEGYLELFRTNRCRGRRAGDMPVVAKWCLENLDLPSSALMSEEDLRVSESSFPEDVSNRGKLFFTTRTRFIELDKEKWLSLNSVYQPLWDTLKNWGAEKVIILTYKNRTAVIEACQHFGLTLNPENVFSGDGGTTKAENFARIESTHPRESYTFIDDAIHNLKEITHQKVNLRMATWGYSAPGDEDLAKEAGIAVVDLAGAIDLISNL